MDDHKNPDGTMNGITALAELSGLSRSEIVAIAQRMKANHAKLDACPRHEFEALITAPPGAGRYRCSSCGGDVDVHAYRWHEKGRRTA